MSICSSNHSNELIYHSTNSLLVCGFVKESYKNDTIPMGIQLLCSDYHGYALCCVLTTNGVKDSEKQCSEHYYHPELEAAIDLLYKTNHFQYTLNEIKKQNKPLNLTKALFISIICQHTSCLKYLWNVKKWKSPTFKLFLEPYHVTETFFALHVACATNSLECTKILLQYPSIDVNRRSGAIQEHPLNVAAEGGFAQIVQCLLNNNADVNQANIYSVGALYKACALGTQPNAKGNYIETIKLLLAAGANTNKAPLLIVVESGNIEVVELLLQYKANVNVSNHEGVTGLMIAANRGNKDMVELLLKYKANVNVENIDKVIALHAAASMGHTEIIEILLNHGADYTHRSTQGLNPIGEAVVEGRLNSVKLIYKHLSVNERDELMNGVNDLYGNTLLHLACHYGYNEIAKYLVEVVKVDLKKNKKNNTALKCAKNAGHQNIVSWLSKLSKV